MFRSYSSRVLLLLAEIFVYGISCAKLFPFPPSSFLFFSFLSPFSLQRFALIVVEAYSSPASPVKGTISRRRKEKRILPRRARVSIAGAPCLKERFGGFQRTFDPFFFAGTTNIPSITIFLEGREIGGEQRWMVSRRFWSLSQPPAPLELDVLRVSFPPSLASLPISRSLDAKRSSRLAAGQRHGGSLPCAF